MSPYRPAYLAAVRRLTLAYDALELHEQVCDGFEITLNDLDKSLELNLTINQLNVEVVDLLNKGLTITKPLVLQQPMFNEKT